MSSKADSNRLPCMMAANGLCVARRDGELARHLMWRIEESEACIGSVTRGLMVGQAAGWRTCDGRLSD